MSNFDTDHTCAPRCRMKQIYLAFTFLNYHVKLKP